MTVRITITLPDLLVSELDKLAEDGNLSRSAIIREASADYVVHALDEAKVERRRKASQDLMDLLDEMRAAPKLDDRPSLEILREMRGPLDRDIDPKDRP